MAIKEFAARSLAVTQPEIQPELVPIKHFAYMLGVSIWTARGWAYDGKISSCKISRSLLIPRTEITRLISENMRPRIDGRK